MADRYYDRSLKCGCFMSSDAGGCVMPCYSEYGSKEAEAFCKKCWDEWKETDDYKEYEKECIEKNVYDPEEVAG